jgi:hypothetical protein
VTLNDPVYEEAAEALAKRAVKETEANVDRHSNPESVLDALLSCEARLVLSRDPTVQELAVLRGLFKKTVTTENKPILKGASLQVSGNSGRETKATNKELDGLKAVGNVLLNLDAALNR